MRDPSISWVLRRSFLASGVTADRTARLLGIVGCLVGVVGLTVSLIASWRTDVRNQAAEHQQFIRDTYATYLEMNHFQMQQPEIAHELVTPADYLDEITRVQPAFSLATPDERARSLLREEGFAYYVFSSFERLAYEANAPESTRSKELDRFLQRQLEYYARVILPNPRLVYYWRDAHGCEYYDWATREKYDKFVPNLSELPSDPFGPFARQNHAIMSAPPIETVRRRANALRCFNRSTMSFGAR
jgi:hypothetical protein